MFIISDKTRARWVYLKRVWWDKELKLEDEEASHILDGAGDGGT